mmetsp:Transcript_14999/g.36269  ORF Transcript_14999/g.36269 Transcript_14999/m.36269 type:complete len:338 (+) Transcript_14999:884-1897(+)
MHLADVCGTLPHRQRSSHGVRKAAIGAAKPRRDILDGVARGVAAEDRAQRRTPPQVQRPSLGHRAGSEEREAIERARQAVPLLAGQVLGPDHLRLSSPGCRGGEAYRGAECQQGGCHLETPRPGCGRRLCDIRSLPRSEREEVEENQRPQPPGGVIRVPAHGVREHRRHSRAVPARGNRLHQARVSAGVRLRAIDGAEFHVRHPRAPRIPPVDPQEDDRHGHARELLRGERDHRRRDSVARPLLPRLRNRQSACGGDGNLWQGQQLYGVGPDLPGGRVRVRGIPDGASRDVPRRLLQRRRDDVAAGRGRAAPPPPRPRARRCRRGRGGGAGRGFCDL